MTNIVELNGVGLEYPIYSIKAQSLRNAVVNMAVGGKLLKNGQDLIFIKALDNINFTLQEGDRLGILGHNGAGKTTLLKVLAGVYEPTRGRISVNGRISSMIDIHLGVDPNITGTENIINMARRRGFTTRQIQARIPEIVEFSELGSFIDLPFKTYSAGMCARLVFAVATCFEPDILLLDEWVGAGDAGFFEKAEAKMNDILSKSRVMILATHSRDLVQRVCNKVLVLNSSNQIYFGDCSGWDFANQRIIENV
ncbi:ABC transporter ATP-binding protein [Asticcacaulis sp. BYS171W]|uniref:ABC transporter ATP-binding protein n=1 Tax=Asticcacaulis aquaticus TaxID=2984212 RepID=A0ABT5HS26_9CAUL|nr:ABC transporter ATP-binding protein [Asticcacaulis aquaticus]MDC7682875.1 ABC transporter ATP-binding protein [Asticcacaulis aquaticus]